MILVSSSSFPHRAGVAKLVDAGDSKSPGFGHVGSSPSSGTTMKTLILLINIRVLFFIVPSSLGTFMDNHTDKKDARKSDILACHPLNGIWDTPTITANEAPLAIFCDSRVCRSKTAASSSVRNVRNLDCRRGLALRSRGVDRKAHATPRLGRSSAIPHRS